MLRPIPGPVLSTPRSARGAPPSQLQVYEQHLSSWWTSRLQAPSLVFTCWCGVGWARESGSLGAQMILVQLVLRRTSSACPQVAHKDQSTVPLDSHSTKPPLSPREHPTVWTLHSVLCTFNQSLFNPRLSAPWRQAACLALLVTELALSLAWRLQNEWMKETLKISPLPPRRFWYFLLPSRSLQF